MRNTIGITIFLAIVALLALLGMQYIWITKSYKQENERIRLTTLQLIKKEILIEVSQKTYSQDHEKGTIRYYGGNFANKTVSVVSKNNGIEINSINRNCKTIEEWYEYIQNMYTLYHNDGIDLQRLDSSFTVALTDNKITIPHKLELVDRVNKSIKESTNNDISGRYKLAIDTIPLGIDDKDGLVVKFDNSFSGMFSQFKNILYVSGVFVIILLFILMYLAQTISTQVKLSQAREEYVNFMIHEIRNPVAYLSQMLNAHDLKMDIGKYTHKAYISIESLKMMLEKLQAVSSCKRLTINPIEIKIKEELEKIVEVYTDDKTLVVVEAETELETITADKLHYLNAIRNLVGNSSKYRKDGNAKIVIRYWKENDQFKLSVIDDGIGIPLLYQQLIFDKGYRVPTFKSVKRTGFGLGLAYVKMVAEAHNGNVTVQSKYKEGSTFTISIQ